MADGALREALFVPPAVKPPAAPLPQWRVIWTMLDNPIEVWPQAVYEEPFYCRPGSTGRFLYVTDPDALKTILLDEADAFPKDWMFERVTRPALGDGLLTAKGELWRWQRRAASPAFRAENVAAMVPAMTAAADRALERWRAKGEGARLDIHREMTGVTLDVILQTMLSGGEGIDTKAATRRINDYLETLGGVTVADLLQWPEWARIAMAPRGYRALVDLKRRVDAMIALRRHAPARGDLVDLLMAAQDPKSGRRMDDTLLRDNLLTFIGAGHETTALALTWSLYLIGSHAPTAERLLQEIEAVAGGETVTAAHVERMTFAKAVVQEAMRLYPPVPILTRMAARRVVAGGRTIESGTFLFIPIYALHRHRRLWRDPDAFDPERFLDGEAAALPRFAYMPFGGGPRVCIGQGFALTEAVAILATLLRGAALEPDPAHTIRPRVRVTLRPHGGMPMTLRLRG